MMGHHSDDDDGYKNGYEAGKRRMKEALTDPDIIWAKGHERGYVDGLEQGSRELRSKIINVCNKELKGVMSHGKEEVNENDFWRGYSQALQCIRKITTEHLE